MVGWDGKRKGEEGQCLGESNTDYATPQRTRMPSLSHTSAALYLFDIYVGTIRMDRWIMMI